MKPAMVRTLADERTCGDTQALIAEARAHARRRRRRLALVLLIAAAMAATAVIAASLTAGSTRKTTVRDRLLPPAGPTGVVIGHLAACFGIAPILDRPAPVTPGTVFVLRGKVTWKQVMPGTWKVIVPKEPVVATAHIRDNYHQIFRFALPPGHYVVLGDYGNARHFDGTFGTTPEEVSVLAGQTIRLDLPNACK
jgi:hypothetical protein